MAEQPVLHLVAGDGIVARKATELLFVPTGSMALLDVFRETATGEGLDAVTEFCEAQDFELDEFVALDWSSGLKVAVFGDVELTSNQKSLPRLSGTDAGTWVERSLRKIDGTIEIGVSMNERIEATDLVEGRAQAGGFVLILEELPVPERSQHRQSAFRTHASGDRIHEPAVEPVADVLNADTAAPREPAPTEADVDSPGADVPEAFESTRPDEPTPADVDAPGSPLHDVGAAPEAARLADNLLGVPNEGASASNPYAVGPEDDTVVPTPEMRSIVDSLVSEAAPPAPPPVSSGTPWQLQFVDGDVEVVDRDLVLGRNPQFEEDDGPQGARLVPLAGTNLSRSHLRVSVRGGAIFLTDLGSKNGSFIVTTGDGQLVQLEPHSERRVDAGTIVQTGSVRFFVESRPES